MYSRISRHPARSRRIVASLLGLFALACGTLLLGCAGGSGSSGFDALAAENAAIDRALDSQDCQMEEGLTICVAPGMTAPTPPLPTFTTTPLPTSTTAPPPSTATPPATSTTTPLATGSAGPIDHRTATRTLSPVSGTVTPTISGTVALFPTSTVTLPVPSEAPTRVSTATPTHVPTRVPTATSTRVITETPTPSATPAEPGVETNVAPSKEISCEQAGPGQPCIFMLTFVPSGLPDNAVYRVAVRMRDPDSDWMILPVSDNAAGIPVELNGPPVQIAILVFLTDPGFVPDEVDLLADSGADFAFVTPLLTAM